MVQLQGQEFIPDPAQAAKIIMPLQRTLHNKDLHKVTSEDDGIHVKLDAPIKIENPANRMALPECVEIVVENPKNGAAAIVTHDKNGTVQFRFGAIQMVEMLYNHLSGNRLT